MPIEQSFGSFRKDIDRLTHKNKSTSYMMTYLDALNTIRTNELFQSKLGKEIEERMIDSNNAKRVIKNKSYFRKLKLEYIDKVSDVINKNNIQVKNYKDSQILAKDIVEDLVGYSILKTLMYDDDVTDVYCIKWNKIFYEKAGESHPLKFNYTFRDEKHYKDFIERLLKDADKSMLDNGENKVIDFDLYEDRYNAISTAVSPNDYVLTIRKHKEEHIKLPQLIENNCLSQKFSDLLGMLLLGECNLVVAGITGSGKTTTMRALLDYHVSKANKRMLVCEDTRELFPENDHTLELVTSKGTNQKNDIGLRDLVILALRQKPKYIVIGEVRGVEAETAVEAMATGHCTLFSIHAGTPIDVINRLDTKYLMQMPSLGVDVVERIIGSSLDYIIIQDDIPNIGRRVTSLTEVAYDYTTKSVKLTPIVKYDFRKNDFIFLNKLASDKAEKMLRKGITIEQLDEHVNWDSVA